MVQKTHLCSSKSTCNNRRSSVFFGGCLKLYNKDLRQLELELSQILTLAFVAEDSEVGSWQLPEK
jgi:hypothetical protein